MPMSRQRTFLQSNVIGQRFTDDATASLKAVCGLQTVEDVFEHFALSVELEIQNENGEDVTETMTLKSLGDF